MMVTVEEHKWRGSRSQNYRRRRIMRTERHCGEDIRLPEWEDFIKDRPIFKDLDGLLEILELFKRIVTPLVFFEARAYSKIKLPAVLAIGDPCLEWAKQYGKDWSTCFRQRQLAGSVTCFLLELNSLRKTNSKRTVPHDAFSKGEVYEITACR
jgi:hypothetical protein